MIPNKTFCLIDIHSKGCLSQDILHDLEHSLGIFKFGCEPKADYVITTLHDLKTTATKISVRQPSLNAKALSLWQYQILKQTGDQ
jgi:hypothetical protein